MKIRYGFVTNSSSTSYVVVSESGVREQGFAKGEKLAVGEHGERNFGWSEITYTDMYDKINFAYLQTIYGKSDEWLSMLTKALKEYAGFSSVEYKLAIWQYDDTDEYGGYIDHQSAANEGMNTEIFDDYETLLNFLFGCNSKIVGGNDNNYGKKRRSQ